MIEVFKTNIDESEKAERVQRLLLVHFPGHNITFDLEDCDRILRVEGNSLKPETIERIVQNAGFECCILE
jgi:hypothetical protein